MIGTLSPSPSLPAEQESQQQRRRVTADVFRVLRPLIQARCQPLFMVITYQIANRPLFLSTPDAAQTGLKTGMFFHPSCACRRSDRGFMETGFSLKKEAEHRSIC